MGDVTFNIIWTIVYDRSVARIKLSVLGHSFCEIIIVVVHFLETGHVWSKILEDGRSITEDCVCCEEGTVEWEVNGDRVGGVTRGGEKVEGSEVGVCDCDITSGHW